MKDHNPLAGIPDSSSTTRLPQISVDIGKPENCQYPVETPDDFNYRLVQDNNRARRTGKRH